MTRLGERPPTSGDDIGPQALQLVEKEPHRKQKDAAVP